MGKISVILIPAALALNIFGASCAYGHTLVFGPEFFSSEGGKPQQVVKTFSVQDASRKFIVSVQSGAASEKGAVRGAVKINGKRIFPPVRMNAQPRMYTKHVRLQEQNEISADVASEAAAPVVTVMSLKEQKVSAKIPPIGDALEIEGYSSIIFPAGTFDTSQKVTLSVSASPAIQDIFEAHATAPRLPYEIRINTGNRPPKKDIEVSVKYPDAFFHRSTRSMYLPMCTTIRMHRVCATGFL